MSTLKIMQWVSCLALAAMVASCSGQAGSPIQEGLDAQIGDSTQYASDGAGMTDEENLNLPGLPAAAGEQADKGASYTPGLPCIIPGGIAAPSPLQYGWKGGIVNDMAAAAQVQLLSSTTGPLAWNAYAFKELAPGALQQVTLKGFGKNLAVYMYNWNAPSWDFKGVFNLSAATPAVMPVTPPEAPNGVTFMICVQIPTAETFITGLETQVF